MRYVCCEERRLRVVKLAGQRNGIDYLEVAITAAADPLRQRTLFVRLLKPAAGIHAEQVTIDGGERIRTVGVEWVAPANALPASGHERHFCHRDGRSLRHAGGISRAVVHGSGFRHSTTRDSSIFGAVVSRQRRITSPTS